MTGVATMQKKSLFCVQYPLHVFTSDVVSLHPFHDSTSYYCVTMHLLLLWWSRIKKKEKKKRKKEVRATFMLFQSIKLFHISE